MPSFAVILLLPSKSVCPLPISDCPRNRETSSTKSATRDPLLFPHPASDPGGVYEVGVAALRLQLGPETVVLDIVLDIFVIGFFDLWPETLELGFLNQLLGLGRVDLHHFVLHQIHIETSRWSITAQALEDAAGICRRPWCCGSMVMCGVARGAWIELVRKVTDIIELYQVLCRRDD
eukprot:7970500-Pyramimonas_sp.AAC.1